MATEDAFIRNIIEEEQRQKERDKKRKAHEDASKQRERKGKTLDEWEREEGGPVQEAQVAMAHTQRAVRRKEATALAGDTRLLEVKDLEKAEQELTVAEDDGIKLEPFNLKEERERGHFDEAGNYVEDAKGSDEEEADAWLGSEEASVVSEEVRRRLEEREARERAAEAAGPLTAAQIARLQHETAGLLEAGETLAGGLRRLAKALPKRGAKAVDAAAQGRFDRLTELGSLLLDAGETDVYSQTKEYFARAASVYIDDDEDEGGRPAGGLLASTPGTAAYEEADEDMFGGNSDDEGHQEPSGAKTGTSEAAPAAAAVPTSAGPATSSEPSAEPRAHYASWPIKELRRLLTERGVDTSTVVEKDELIDRVVEAVAQGSASKTPVPPEGYTPDPASGYCYSEASGLYWDPKSGGFYDGRSGLWYRWDAASAQFVEWKPCQPPFSHVASRAARVVDRACGTVLPSACRPLAHAIAGCDGPWGALVLCATLAVIAMVMSRVLSRTCRELRRILFSEKGSSAAARANRTLQVLREADPAAYPPFPHHWQRLVIHHGWSQVLYCCGCQADIGSRTFSHAASFCSLCGAVAHTACLRHVGDTCRPLSLEGHTHWWQAPTSVVRLEDEEGAVSGSQACHLCGEGCATVPVTPEPSWQCGLCSAAVHVSCWCAAHARTRPTVQAAFDALRRSAPPLRAVSPFGAERRRELEAALQAVRERRGARVARRDAAALDRCAPASEVALPPWDFGWAMGPRDGAGHDEGAERDGAPRRAWWRRRRRDGAEHEGLADWRAKLRVCSAGASAGPPSALAPTGRRPMLVFVNTKSGAREGATLRLRLLRELHPLQVVELPQEQPEPALEQFEGLARLRVLVIGGDGTVSWVLSALERRRAGEERAGDGPPAHRDGPPVGVIPLGTGNDLARVLGWGAGADPWLRMPCEQLVREVEHAAPVFLDRWAVRIRRAGKEGLEGVDDAAEGAQDGAQAVSERDGGDGTSVDSDDDAAAGARADDTGAAEPTTESTTDSDDFESLSMTNYLGIGTDAGVALGFHAMREGYPNLFGSQLGNKLLYTLLGARQMLDGLRGGDISDCVSLRVDGHEVALPAGTQCLVLLNINSFMGGVDVWGAGRDERAEADVGRGTKVSTNAPSNSTPPCPPAAERLARQRYCDGKLEVVALFGIWHLGKLHVGLDSALHLAQGAEVRVGLRRAVPMQVDGEARSQPAGEILVRRQGQVLMLKRVHPDLAGIIKAVRSGLEDAVTDGMLDWTDFLAVHRRISRRVQDQLDYAP